MEYDSFIRTNDARRSNMGGRRDSHIEWSKSEKDKYCMLSLISGNLKKKATNELIYKTEIEL